MAIEYRLGTLASGMSRPSGSCCPSCGRIESRLFYVLPAPHPCDAVCSSCWMWFQKQLLEVL